MELPMPIKIRIWVILALSAVLFGIVGWAAVKPWEPAGAMTILLAQAPVQVFLVLLVLAVVGTGLATVAGGHFGGLLGALAVPAGLSVWSLRSGTMERLLLDYVTPDERAEMYYRLAGEVIFLFGTVVLGVVIAHWLVRRFGAEQSDEETTITEPKKADRRTGPQSKLPQWLDMDRLRGIGAVVLSCVMAIVLLKIFARSGQTWMEGTQRVWISTVPVLGQIIFAVAAAFFLATMATYQLFTVNLWYFLPIPALVAVTAYIFGALPGSLEPLTAITAPVVVSSAAFTTVLPIQYIGVGTLAVALGYWYGINLHDYLSGRGE